MQEIKESDEAFGLHQTLDIYRCDEKTLNSEANVLSFLSVVPDKIGMTIIDKPRVKRCAAVSDKDKGGISGSVMIAESHVYIHTFPAIRFASIDVYSCKPFDSHKVKELVGVFFRAKVFEEQVFKRANLFGKYCRPLINEAVKMV